MVLAFLRVAPRLYPGAVEWTDGHARILDAVEPAHGSMIPALLGRDELAQVLRERGRDPQVVSPAQAGLPDGLLVRDKHLLRLSSGPFELLSLRMEGMVGPGANLRRGAMSFRVGRVPVASRKVLPVRMHWLVLVPPVEEHEARLRQEVRGLVRRERRGMRWQGRRLARVLQQDGALQIGLEANLGLDDLVRVRPDPRIGRVRVVYGTLLTLDVGLVVPGLAQVYREALTPELLATLERIGEHVHAMTDARFSSP